MSHAQCIVADHFKRGTASEQQAAARGVGKLLKRALLGDHILKGFILVDSLPRFKVVMARLFYITLCVFFFGGGTCGTARLRFHLRACIPFVSHGCSAKDTRQGAGSCAILV